VSSLLPAAFFCLILLILFKDFFPIEFFEQVQDTSLLIFGQWLLLAVIPIWIGFFLFSSVDWVVRIFEGYYLPEFLSKRMIERNQKYLQAKTKKYREISRILKKDVSDRVESEEWKYEHWYDEALKELKLLELDMPFDEGYVMPTKLGNIIKASEVYAQDRYSIEAVNVWPRLFAVLPAQFLKDMEEKNNHFMFLLNSCLLLFIASGVAQFAGLAGYYREACSISWICKIFQKQYLLELGFHNTTPLRFIFFSVVLFLGGLLLYTIAVNAARDFGYFYRAGFDLYRMDLLLKFKRELPKSLDEEQNLWLEISEFLAVGENLVWETNPISYDLRDLEKQISGAYGYPPILSKLKSILSFFFK